MGAHFLEILWCPSEKMAERQFDVAISRTRVEETSAIQLAFGNASYQLSDADFAELELRFCDDLTLAFHDISVAKHLLVHPTDDLLFLGVIVAREQFKGRFTLIREAFDPQ